MSAGPKQVAPGIWRRPLPGAPRWAFVGGIHGDEPQGADAVRALSAPDHPIWQECTADLTLVVANLAALDRGTRGSVEGADLNRQFGENPLRSEAYECGRAEELRQVLDGVSMLVDLHQTLRPIPALAVVRDTPQHLLLATRAGLSMAVVGAERIYGDTLLADFVNRSGGVGITVETGQAGTDSARQVAESTLRTLWTSAPLDSPDAATGLEVWEIQGALSSPGPDLTFLRPLENASPVKAGEVLGESAQGQVIAPGDGIVFLPREGQPAGEPCGVFARKRA